MSELLGFGSKGPRYGSLASRYQSRFYGGETPSGGCFACCQRRGMSDEGGCCCCSIFLFILGALLIAFGVIFGFYPDVVVSMGPTVYYNSSFIQLGFFQLDKLMIAAGVFMCLASIVSCSECCTSFFHVLAFIIICVCIGIMSNTLSNFSNKAINVKIEINMNRELQEFDNTTEGSLWSFIQQDLQCCGVFNSSDWLENKYYANGTVPDSCCKNVTSSCGETAGPDEIFPDGCLLLFEDQIFNYFWFVVILLSCLCVIGGLLICSCCFQVCGSLIKISQWPNQENKVLLKNL